MSRLPALAGEEKAFIEGDFDIYAVESERLEGSANV